jgi:hypothetical protein
MEHIYQIVELAKKQGLATAPAHYVTMLKGSADGMFAYFDEILTYADEHLSHYVLQATLSVNSPTPVEIF